MRRILGVLAIVLFAAACGSSSKPEAVQGTPVPSTSATNGSTAPSGSKNVKLTGFTADPNKTYTAKLDTNFGPIEIMLDSKTAPKASGRFIELARAGFYDGLTWHRVVKDFVIQAGDPTGTGSGGSGNPPVVDSTGSNGYPVGSVAAAKTGTDPAGTFDSQFFIVTGSQGATLPNDYALFGKVTSGIENAKKIEALAPPAGDGPPTQKVIINKVTITES
jgi:cyclophilin family peptidyl-prolyl cis-trans isomerase